MPARYTPSAWGSGKLRFLFSYFEFKRTLEGVGKEASEACQVAQKEREKRVNPTALPRRVADHLTEQEY